MEHDRGLPLVYRNIYENASIKDLDVSLVNDSVDKSDVSHDVLWNYYSCFGNRKTFNWDGSGADFPKQAAGLCQAYIFYLDDMDMPYKTEH